MYLHVMWRFLEQKSFPLTDEEYQEQLNAVAAFVDAWGVADMVRQGIAGASRKGPGHTGNLACLKGLLACPGVPWLLDSHSSHWHM